jgi:hypothetical protein
MSCACAAHRVTRVTECEDLQGVPADTATLPPPLCSTQVVRSCALAKHGVAYSGDHRQEWQYTPADHKARCFCKALPPMYLSHSQVLYVTVGARIYIRKVPLMQHSLKRFCLVQRETGQDTAQHHVRLAHVLKHSDTTRHRHSGSLLEMTGMQDMTVRCIGNTLLKSAMAGQLQCLQFMQKCSPTCRPTSRAGASVYLYIACRLIAVHAEAGIPSGSRLYCAQSQIKPAQCIALLGSLA